MEGFVHKLKLMKRSMYGRAVSRVKLHQETVREPPELWLSHSSVCTVRRTSYNVRVSKPDASGQSTEESLCTSPLQPFR